MAQEVSPHFSFDHQEAVRREAERKAVRDEAAAARKEVEERNAKARSEANARATAQAEEVRKRREAEAEAKRAADAETVADRAKRHARERQEFERELAEAREREIWREFAARVGFVYEQFQGLGSQPPEPAWSKLLGSPKTLKDAEKAFKKLCLERHPDRGGSHEAMVELNAAMESARRWLR